jgi:hypothetical protein
VTRRSRYWIVLGLCALLAACEIPGCDDSSPMMPSPTGGDGPANFAYAYRHRSASLSLDVTLGVWMHRATQFTREAIADWLNVPFANKELLEPINALWVDPIAGSEDAARDRVVDYVDACGFEPEGHALFGSVPKHSTGYSAVYGNGVWKPQYDIDEAWVEGFLGGDFENNHGRIFPAFLAASQSGQPVYVTSGAFSREGSLGTPVFAGIDCALNRENCHPYKSFNTARDRLACGVAGWVAFGPVDFGNRFPLSLMLSFSTGDHDGVLVFERVE